MERVVQYLLVENLALSAQEQEEFFDSFRNKSPSLANENQPHRLLSERPNILETSRIFKAAFLPGDILPVRIEVELALIIGDPPPTVTHRDEVTAYGVKSIFENTSDLAAVLYFTDSLSARAYVEDNEAEWNGPDT